MPSPRPKRTMMRGSPDSEYPPLEGPFTLYAMNGYIFRFDGIEDPRTAVDRLMTAWKTAEQCVAYSLFSAPDESYLAKAFAGENPGVVYIDEAPHVDLSVLTRSMTKADQAVVYAVTAPSVVDRRFEAQVDVMESREGEKQLVNTMSMPLSGFVRDYGDPFLDLYRVSVDVGHCRLVHSENFELTLAKLENAGAIEPYPSKSTRGNCLQQLIRAFQEHERRAGLAESGPPAPSGF